ncbi:hypothetical protein GBA52_005832 [Prunus armeniaca]|nr:hypothetical protein GBA52_005832 [Prunus armeniaca]
MEEVKRDAIKNGRRLMKSLTERNPKQPLCWIASARLEEDAGEMESARQLIQKGCEECPNSVDVWLEACRIAIANARSSPNSNEAGKAVIACGLKLIPNSVKLWMQAANLEHDDSNKSRVLSRGLQHIPDSVLLRKAVVELATAAKSNEEEEEENANARQSMNLSCEPCEPERARMNLAEARERGGGTERVWMKSAIVERGLGNVEEERKLLDEGLKKFPSFFKLWLMLGQLEERLDRLEKAKEAYDLGLKHCPNSIPLWLSLVNLEENLNGVTSARAVLTLARNKNPHNPQLWLAATRTELRHGNNKEADILMARALHECPNSGILWAAYIESMVPLPPSQWMAEIMDALRKCDYDPHVIAAVAKLFWHHSEVKRARTWLDRAVTIAPDIGDFWALYFKFELQHGTDENQKDVLRRCIASQPKHGEKWQPISKALHNSHQPTEAILHQVVAVLGKEESSQQAGQAPQTDRL